ncbi:MAG: hypothetical protein IPL03_00530 [Sterolibacteriaceae bacterium]|nr:hypothetical protein [Candidatus Methylophosphatis haderslevensis]
MKPSKMFMSIAAAMAFGSGAALADSDANQVRYKTGFEAPDFVAGQPLAGQQGWNAPPPLSAEAAVVSKDKPRQGKQSVFVPGADLVHQDFINELTQGYYDAIGSYRKPICLIATQSGCKTLVDELDSENIYTGYEAKGRVVRVSAHVRVDGARTLGNNFFSASVGAIAVGTDSDTGKLAPEGVGELAISSDGHVYGYSGAHYVPTPFLVKDRVTLDEWHTLAVEADFGERKTRFFVDDEYIGWIWFDNQVTTDLLLRGSMLVYAAPESGTAERTLYEKKNYSAHFDQFAIKVEHPHNR